MKNILYVILFISFVFSACLMDVKQAYSVFSEVQSSYDKYKLELKGVEEDTKKSQLRHHWINVADNFYKLYADNPKWLNRPAALFRSAVAYDELSKRSYAKKDREQAATLYKQLVEEFPDSVLADDALYNLAVLYNERMNDPAHAQEHLNSIKKYYTDSDHHSKAKEYALIIEEKVAPSLRQASSVELEEVIYEGLLARDKGDRIEIQIDLDSSKRKEPTWLVDYIAPQKGTNSPARLVLTLENAAAKSDIRPSYDFKNMGIFSRFVVDYSKRNAIVIIMDFKKLEFYHIYYNKNADTLIIEATERSKVLLKGIETKKLASSKQIPSEFLPYDLARKKGLNVRTVIIDPGHGGRDPGTAHNGIIEKNLVLDLSLQLGNELKKLGYKVEYTRTRDEFITLTRRAEIAKEKKADIFVSVHANASENIKIGGLETYFLDYPRYKEKSSAKNITNDVRIYESERFASLVHREMFTSVNSQGYMVKNGGIKGSLFMVLENINMPGVLLEVGYVSNAKDAQNLKNKNYISSIAKGIAKGIDSYAKALKIGIK